MHNIHHLLGVLVSLGSFLCQQVFAVDADSDATSVELVEQVFVAQGLFGGGTALATASTMTAGAKALLEGARSSNEDKGVATHIAWDEYRLTYGLIFLRNAGIVRWESTGCAFAVDADALHVSVDHVLFD